MTHEQFLARKGHDSFTHQYLPLCGKMYALAYNLLRDRNEARDCVQDVYAELWNKRDTLKIDKTLVLKMVHDKCLARTGDNIDRLCDTSTPDAPIVIVNVIINEEHHYHKGAVHDDKSTHITLK